MPISDHNNETLKSTLAQALAILSDVYKMVDDKKYCIDVLNELKTVQAVLDESQDALLRQHLEICVVDAIKNQDSERVVNELMLVFKQSPGLYKTSSDIQT